MHRDKIKDYWFMTKQHGKPAYFFFSSTTPCTCLTRLPTISRLLHACCLMQISYQPS